MEERKNLWKHEVEVSRLNLELLEAGIQATVGKIIKEPNGMEKIELLGEVLSHAKNKLKFAENAYQEAKEKENE